MCELVRLNEAPIEKVARREPVLFSVVLVIQWVDTDLLVGIRRFR
jgi:hypothetical protein